MWEVCAEHLGLEEARNPQTSQSYTDWISENMVEWNMFANCLGLMLGDEAHLRGNYFKLEWGHRSTLLNRISQGLEQENGELRQLHLRQQR